MNNDRRNTASSDLEAALVVGERAAVKFPVYLANQLLGGVRAGKRFQPQPLRRGVTLPPPSERFVRHLQNVPLAGLGAVAVDDGGRRWTDLVASGNAQRDTSRERGGAGLVRVWLTERARAHRAVSHPYGFHVSRPPISAAKKEKQGRFIRACRS